MMKNTLKIKRIRLDVDCRENLFLYGIVSAEPDYKLSLSLNRKLGISLRNRSPLKVSHLSGKELTFSRFSYSGPPGDISYDLISNRSGKQYLLKKLQNIDYILKIHYPDENHYGTEFVTILRDNEAINAVFPIDTGTFNDKNLQYIIQ